MKIHKNDTVLVIVGKDRGKRGRVHLAFPQEKRVLVDGINLVKRHLRPRGKIRQAGIIDREAPLHISKIMLICPKCHRPTRVGSRSLDDGSELRQCRRCGEVID